MLKALINIELVKHSTSHDLLSDKEYNFHFSRPTVDVLAVITEFVYPALYMNDEAWAVALDILKAFDRLWNAGLLLKYKSYAVSGRIFGQLFIRNCAMRVVSNGHAFSLFNINVGLP